MTSKRTQVKGTTQRLIKSWSVLQSVRTRASVTEFVVLVGKKIYNVKLGDAKLPRVRGAPSVYAEVLRLQCGEIIFTLASLITSDS